MPHEHTALERDPDGSDRSDRSDGSAGDANYAQIGTAYSSWRQPDPRIATAIIAALGSAEMTPHVLNVGAGAGSYEARDRQVTAVEPSATMRAQRPADLPPAIDATAEQLPFADNTFSGSMATFTVHQWGDLAAGLAELRRVTVANGPIVILTCDPDALDRFWLAQYAPEVIDTEARRYPSLATLTAHLGGDKRVQVVDVPVPLDCSDGFGEAYDGRPEMLLDPGARRANSAWSFVAPDTAAAYVEHLRADLASGAWDAQYGHLRQQPTFDGSLRLVIGRGAAREQG